MYRLASRTQYLALLSVLALIITATHTAVSKEKSQGAGAAVLPQCMDGYDNDVDGETDYPQDSDCDSPYDSKEGDPTKDLYLTMSDGLSSVESGDNLTYTIAIRSDSLEPRLATVRFYKPNYTSVTAASENGKMDGSAVVWRNTVIHPGYVKELYVHVNVSDDARTDELLIAEVYVGDMSATDTTKVEDGNNMRVPMEIFVDDGRIYAEPGEVLEYKILVRNTFGEDREYTLRTQLPPVLQFIGATGEYKRVNRSVEWHDQFLPAGGEAVYEISAEIDRETVEFGMIRLRVASEAAFGTDTTTILYEEIPPSSISVKVNDGFQAASVGQELTYAIELTNNRAKLIQGGVDVKDAIPMYTEFVDASEGGYWNGQDVFWKGVTIAPYGKRTLYVTARVRSDAPIGAILRNSVSVEGREAVDQTTVDVNSSKVNRPPVMPTNVLLRKVSDRSEVRPGDTVQYSIILRNTFEHPIRNVVVEDRIDDRYSDVVGSSNGEMIGNRIVWNVPVLNPGDTWGVDYTVRIRPDAPHGVEIANVVSVEGEGLERTSLTERVRTSSIGIVTRLPRSGAPIDLLFVGIMLLLSLLLTNRQSTFNRQQSTNS